MVPENENETEVDHACKAGQKWSKKRKQCIAASDNAESYYIREVIK